MNEMTLSSRHRIQNLSPGGLRPSTLPLGHGGSPKFVVGGNKNKWPKTNYFYFSKHRKWMSESKKKKKLLNFKKFKIWLLIK